MKTLFAIVLCILASIGTTASATGTARQSVKAAYAAAQLWQPGAQLLSVESVIGVDDNGRIICADPEYEYSGWLFSFWGPGRDKTFQYYACGDRFETAEVPEGYSAETAPPHTGINFIDSDIVIKKTKAKNAAISLTGCSGYRMTLTSPFGTSKIVDPKSIVWNVTEDCADSKTLLLYIDPKSGKILDEKMGKSLKKASTTGDDED